jgi:hypothetical protein
MRSPYDHLSTRVESSTGRVSEGNMTRGQSYGLPLNLVQGFSSNRDRGSYFGEVDLRSSFQPFTVFSEQFGFVPKLFCAQTLVPRVIEAEAALISSILFTDHALARAQKECILLALAAANDNPYCSSLHYQTLK